MQTYVPLLDDKNSSEEKNPNTTHTPGVLIVQQLDGVLADQTIKTAWKELDDRNSLIYGTSVFAKYENGKRVGIAKNTDDQIVVGYTSEGLPFQIVVDGFFGNDPKTTFLFIDKYVVPLIDDYAEKVSTCPNPNDIIKTLISTIYDLRAQHSPSVEFTMSIGITYEKDNELFCAGFGIGDTGLVLRRSNGEIQQLVHSTSVNGFKDAFDDFSVKTGIERVINRNSIFNVLVNPGDELFGYTYLFRDLLEVEKIDTESYQLISNHKTIDRKDEVIKYKLATDKLSKNRSIFNEILHANNELFLAYCKQAIKQEAAKFGDDCIMSTVIIPSATLQNTLKRKIFHQEKTRLNTLLESKKDTGIYSAGKRVHDTVVKLDDKTSINKLPELTRHLAASNNALANPNEENISTLAKRAQKIPSQSSPTWRALGVAMMILGAGLAIFGGLILAASSGATFTAFLAPLGVMGIGGGIGLTVAGVAIFSTGLGFFSRGRQKGISKDMSHLAKGCAKPTKHF